MDLTTGAGFVVALSGTEDGSGCIGILHCEVVSVAHPEETYDARVKKVRKAESAGTTAAEPLAAPNKKMRSADGVVLVANNAITSGPGSGGRKSHAKRSEEARARRKATKKKHQEARKASIRGLQNMTETDGVQEEEEAD